MSGKSSILEFKQVSHSFGPQPILRDISFEVPPGQTLAIIGESGCGKTVLLKLMVRLLSPDAGQILFEGRDLNLVPAQEFQQLRRRMGFLFQGAALFDSLSVYENVAYPLRALQSRDESAVAATVRERLKEVGLPPGVETKSPGELSGGMRKRVGLARALALNPDVMLYDEPTTGLDPVMTDLINELIMETRRRRPITSIVVTHDMKTVRAVADRVIMLYPLPRFGAGEGQIIFDGTLPALLESGDGRVRGFIS